MIIWTFGHLILANIEYVKVLEGIQIKDLYIKSKANQGLIVTYANCSTIQNDIGFNFKYANVNSKVHF